MGDLKSCQNYRDFRTFLVAHAHEAKRKNPSWTYGRWARALGLKSTSSISKIVSGCRNPGPVITEKLIQYFRFNKTESEYFRDLVKLNKIKDDSKLSILLREQMLGNASRDKVRIIEHEMFSVISNWYYLVIREITRLKAFREDPKWIAQRLNFKAPHSEIKVALKTLENLGLVQRSPTGGLILGDSRVNTRDDIANEGIKRHHEQMLELGKKAIRQFKPEDREITSSSFVMDIKDIQNAKEMIRQFKEKFTRTFENGDGNTVFQIQLQLFPITKREMGSTNE